MTSSKIVKPWHKESAVWWLISPLFLVFCVCGVLVGFAVMGSDDRISDDYYKEGKMINNRFAAEQRAKTLRLSAVVDFSKGRVRVTMNGEPLRSHELLLYLSHPAKAGQDTRIILKKKSLRLYESSFDASLRGRWYVRIEPVLTKDKGQKIWRISGENNFDNALNFPLE